MARALPNLLLGAIAGPLVDRRERKGLLLAMDLVRAVLVAALPFLIGKPLLVNANSKAVEIKKRTSPYPDNGRPRKHFSKVFAVDSETMGRLKLIKAAIPEIESLSAAIRYAARVTVKHLPKEPS